MKFQSGDCIVETEPDNYGNYVRGTIINVFHDIQSDGFKVTGYTVLWGDLSGGKHPFQHIDNYFIHDVSTKNRTKVKVALGL